MKKLTKKDLRPREEQEKPNIETAQRVVCLLDYGLCRGKGDPRPGKMCVEAAVAYAMGQEHTDEPNCVHMTVRDAKIDLNDEDGWKSKKSRGEALKRVAVAQLGSDQIAVTNFHDLVDEWANPRLLYLAITICVREAVAGLDPVIAKRLKQLLLNPRTRDFGIRHLPTNVEFEMPSFEGYSANSFISEHCLCHEYGDLPLRIIAEGMVQALIKLKSPGCKWLSLAGPQTIK